MASRTGMVRTGRNGPRFIGRRGPVFLQCPGRIGLRAKKEPRRLGGRRGWGIGAGMGGQQGGILSTAFPSRMLSIASIKAYDTIGLQPNARADFPAKIEGKNMRMFTSTCLLAAVLAPMGCQPKYTQPVLEPKALTTQEQEFQQLWQASRKVLIGYHFHIDRQDPRAGVMTTWPMTGKQIFELWRKDAARTIDSGESTLQTIYRAAKVNIRKKADSQDYEPIVEVFVSRSNKPIASIASTSDAYDMFSSRKRRKLTGAQQADNLVDLGNDRALEAKLTADILKEAGRGRRGK